MSTNVFRSVLRTSVPGDHRTAGRVSYATIGNTLTILEGRLFTVARGSAGTFTVSFGQSTNAQFFKGLVSANIECIVADPVAGTNANVRTALLQSVNTNATGSVTGFTFVTLNKSAVVADLADGDQFTFETITRDTEILA